MGAPPALATPSLLSVTGRIQIRRFAVLLLAANVLLPVGQIVYAEVVGEDYAEYFWGEWNAITWFSSVQLLLIALVAFANHQVIGLPGGAGREGPRTRRWVWLVFAAGFVFLSLDERFGFHEYLRDDVFRPRQLFNVPFLRAGDVSMYGYLGVGLVLGYFLLAELRRHRLALVLFAGGVMVAAASVVVDTLAKDITREWVFSRFWTSAFEEVGELWAQMFFAFSFLVLLDERLRHLDQGESGDALLSSARRLVVRLAGVAASVNVLLPLGVYVYALATEQTFWRFFSVEDGPTEWFSSVQCLLIAGVAWANYSVHGMLRRGQQFSLEERGGIWLAFAVGFLVLGCDERFDLHEALRDTVLLPTGLFSELPYIVPGDVGLYLVYALGLGLAAWLVPVLRRWPPALPLLGASFLLGLAVVMIDSLSDAALASWPARTFWDYPFEEVGELWAQLLCLLSLLAVLHGRLGLLTRSESA